MRLFFFVNLHYLQLCCERSYLIEMMCNLLSEVGKSTFVLISIGYNIIRFFYNPGSKHNYLPLGHLYSAASITSMSPF